MKDPLELHCLERSSAIVGGTGLDGVEPAGDVRISADDHDGRVRVIAAQFGYFRRVRSAEDDIRRAGGAHRVEAEYDPAFGYPTSIYIDHEEPMVDEETVFRVQGLRTVH